MWRLSRSISKSRLLGKSNGINIVIFWSKCDSIPIPYCHRGTDDRCRRSQNGFYTPASPIMPTVQEFISPIIQSQPTSEEFISSTQNIGAKKSKANRNLNLKKNRIKIESRGKNTIITSLIQIQVANLWFQQMGHLMQQQPEHTRSAPAYQTG